jgi:D-alanyl-D-alanine carboxypeptidase
MIRLAAGVLVSWALLVASPVRPETGAQQDYAPVACDATKPYEGPPLYAGRIELPPPHPAPTQHFDPAVTAKLERALADALTRTKAGVIAAAVATPSQTWSATRTAEGQASQQRLWWASAGKSLTAVVIMQLVNEGKLSLADPLAKWLPDFPNAKVITIDHLLRHTGGVFSANEDLTARRDPKYRAPAESVAIARTHGPMFCPGQWWRYSNTGYTMLGLIIEALEGRPYHEVVNARIAARLGLTSLRALAPKEEPADVAALRPSDPAEPRMVPNWAWAAGGVVSNADEMLAFWRALVTGELLGTDTTALLFDRLAPMFDKVTYYGRGVMIYVLPAGPPGSPSANAPSRVWLGHSGGAPGAKAIVAWSASERAFVAVALTGDGSAEAAANLLLAQLEGRGTKDPSPEGDTCHTSLDRAVANRDVEVALVDRQREGHPAVEHFDQLVEQRAVHPIQLEVADAMDALGRPEPQHLSRILVRVDRDAVRGLAGLVHARRVGRADFHPHPNRPSQIAHGNRWLVWIGNTS